MRACVRHWKLNVRLRECECVHCTGCGAVACTVITSRVQCPWFWCLGRCEVSRSEGQTPPEPLGVDLCSGRTRIHLPTSWAPVQRESRTVRPISLAFLGGATDSGSSIHPRDSRGYRASGLNPSQPPHGASPRLIKRQRCWRVDPPLAVLRLASSNASAAERRPQDHQLVVLRPSLKAPLAPRGLKNASSEFRWNLNPLLPLM